MLVAMREESCVREDAAGLSDDQRRCLRGLELMTPRAEKS
jgi:hypothetical protein